MLIVRNKLAFVTGGSSGIGLGIVRVLADAGMTVVIGYRREDHRDSALESLADKPGRNVDAVYIDVTERESVKKAVATVERLHGKVDVLCNCAGVNLLGPMDEATYDDWDWILSVNLGGTINVLMEVLPGMKQRGAGHVINVASMASFIPGPGYGVYATSKFAVRGLTESLQLSLAPYGIGVSLVCPGLTKSNIFEAPLHRPSRLSSSAIAVDEQSLARLAAVHAMGMDAEEVGRKTLEGMLRNDLYIFTHPEFRDEVEEICDEVIRSFPPDPGNAPRLIYESKRRKARKDAIELVSKLTREYQGNRE